VIEYGLAAAYNFAVPKRAGKPCCITTKKKAMLVRVGAVAIAQPVTSTTITAAGLNVVVAGTNRQKHDSDNLRRQLTRWRHQNGRS
jgi:hypothetical protein